VARSFFLNIALIPHALYNKINKKINYHFMPDPIPEKNIENISLSDVYAKRAEEEYKRLSSQPTARDKISGSAKSASDKLSGGDSNLGRNLLIGAAVAGGAYLAYNLLFDSEERAETKADESKSSLLGKTLGVLGLGIGGYFLYDFLEGKVDWTEVMEAWDKDGFTGVGSMILDKAKDGVLGWFSSDTLIQIGELLGFPSLVAYAKLMKTKDNLTAAGQGAIDKAKDLIPGLGNPDDTENPGGPLAGKPGDNTDPQAKPGSSPGTGNKGPEKKEDHESQIECHDENHIPVSEALKAHKDTLNKHMGIAIAKAKSSSTFLEYGIAQVMGVGPLLKTLTAGAAFGGDQLLSLAKLPFDAVGMMPTSAVFAFMAVLANSDEITKKIGASNPEAVHMLTHVPKEGPQEQMEHYVKVLQLPEVKEWLFEQNIVINNDEIQEAAKYLSNPNLLEEAMAQTEDWTNMLIKAAIDYVHLTNNERLHKKNFLHLNSFKAIVNRYLPEEDKRRVMTLTENLMVKVNDSGLKSNDLNEFINEIEKSGIKIRREAKRFFYSIQDEGGMVHEGTLCINPDLSVEDQESVARYSLDDTDYSTSLMGVGQAVINSYREELGEWMKEFHSDTEAVDGIGELLLKGGWSIVCRGTSAYLEGAATYYLGPFNLIINLPWALRGDYSLGEALVETANGIAPVVFFTATTALATGQGIPGMKKVLWSSIAYPYTAGKDIWKLLRNSNLSVIKKQVGPKDWSLLFKTPRSYIANDFAQKVNTLNKWGSGMARPLSALAWIPGLGRFKNATAVNNLRAEISEFRQALNLAYEMKMDPTKHFTEANKDKISNIIRDATFKSANDVKLRPRNEGEIDDLIQVLEEGVENKKAKLSNINKVSGIENAQKWLKQAQQYTNTFDANKRLALQELANVGEWDLLNKYAPLGQADLQTMIDDAEGRIKILSTVSPATPDPARTQALTDFDTKTESEKIKTIEDLDTKIAEHHAKMQTEMEGIRNRSGFNTGQRIDIDAEKAKIRATYIPQIEADFRLRAEMSGKLAASGFDFKFHHLELDARLARKFGVPIPKGVAIDENAMKNFIQNHKGKLAKGGLAAAAISGIAYIMLAEDDKEHINISDYSPKPPATPSGTAAEADQKKKIAEAPTVNKLDNPEYVDAEADQLFQELNALGKNYTDYFAIFAEGNEEKIKNFSEDELQRIVKNTVNKHEDALPQIMKILTFERELLNRYMQNHPNHEVNINPALTLSYDPEKKQAYFNYPTAEEFENFAYAYFDATQAALKFPEWVQENKGVKLSADIVQEMLPLWSTYLSAKRANLAARRGQSLDIIGKETGVAMFSAVSDLLTGGALKAGVKGAIAAKGFKGKTLTFFKDFWHGGAAGGAATMTRTEKLANRSGQIMMLDMGVQLSPIAWATISGAGLTQFKTNYYLNPDASKLGDIPANAPRIGFTIDNDPPYDADPDTMKKHAEESINFLINKCYWKNLKYEIIDPHTITIGRTTSNEQITIKRHPDNNPYVQKSNKETGVWELEGLDKAYSNLSQAIAMANLVNDTAEFIKNSGYTAGSDQPFHREQTDRGEVIEFDAGADLPDSLSWDSLRKSAHGAYDLEILNRNKDNNWLDFYNKRLGIETHWIENILNNWYNLKHKK